MVLTRLLKPTKIYVFTMDSASNIQRVHSDARTHTCPRQEALAWTSGAFHSCAWDYKRTVDPTGTRLRAYTTRISTQEREEGETSQKLMLPPPIPIVLWWKRTNGATQYLDTFGFVRIWQIVANENCHRPPYMPILLFVTRTHRNNSTASYKKGEKRQSGKNAVSGCMSDTSHCSCFQELGP